MEDNFKVEDFILKLEYDKGNILTDESYRNVVTKIMFVDNIIHHRTRKRGASIIKFNGRLGKILYDDFKDNPVLTRYELELGDSNNNFLELIQPGDYTKLIYEGDQIKLIVTREKQPDYSMYIKIETDNPIFNN